MSKDVRSLLVIFEDDLYSDQFQKVKGLIEAIRGVKIVEPVPITNQTIELYSLMRRTREDIANKMVELAEQVRRGGE